MSFIWPPLLLSLLLIPVGDTALPIPRYATAPTVDGRTAVRALAQGGQARRRVRDRAPAALLLGGLAVLSVAMARPQAVVSLPQEQGTVILAFDVSASMAATDLQPTRMAAAKAAARDFVARQPAGVTIGVVAFSDSGVSVQTPTTDQATVLAAIDRLTPQRGTSLAEGILASLKVITVAEAGPYANNYYTKPAAGATPSPSPTPVPAGNPRAGGHRPVQRRGEQRIPGSADGCPGAADQGVRIYTVGIGSTAGATVTVSGFQLHTQLDAATLQQISQTTGGTYFAATDVAQLHAVYDNLDTAVVIQPQLTEITAIFAGVGLVLLIGGALTSLLWLGRPT